LQDRSIGTAPGQTDRSRSPSTSRLDIGLWRCKTDWRAAVSAVTPDG
jgi:hypothetical protein